MKSKALILDSLIVIALFILGYGAGRLAGGILIGESDPSWNHFILPPSPKKIIKIVYYWISPTPESEDPRGDTLFVETEDGEFYSYTLFQINWDIVDADPTRWNNPYISKCATEWNGPSEFADLKNYPPVKEAVLDSMGENLWLYPSTSVARCYTLLEDGSLQGWTYSGNVPALMKNRLWKNVLLVAGACAGILAGIFVARLRTKNVELALT